MTPAARPATDDDLAAVAALEQQVFGADAWSAALVADALPDLLVAGDAEVEGWAVTTVAGDVADLQRIAVHPAHRRRGLARALLAASVERAVDRGAERLLLEVRVDNAGALALYAAAGFVPLDTRRRYYRDGSDALVLARALSS